MPEQTLKNAIISWLRGYPYWLQYAGNELLEGDPLSDEMVEATYRLFLEDTQLIEQVGNRAEIIFSEELEQKDHADLFTITEIKGITNVNALAADQVITVCPQLTIVYGGNGTGKSGYTRMLNNAFKGRGDKEILSNVFQRAPNLVASCVFTFADGDGTFDLKFPDDRTHDAFTRFSIFDTQCIKVHLEQENSLLITPAGFDFFNKLITLYGTLEQKLNNAIQARKGTNDFIALFVHPHVIQEIIHALSASTNLAQLKELADYSVDDAKRLDELALKKATLLALNIPAQIREYQALLNALNALIEGLKPYLDIFSSENIAAIRATITSLQHYSALSIQQGISSLKEYSIPAIGSDQWLGFLRAAKQYADQVGVTGKEGEKMEQCVFCLQSLTPKENRLIEAYWQFLQSDAQKQVATLEQQLARDRKRVHDLKPVVFDETSTLYQHMLIAHTEIAEVWKGVTGSFELNKTNLINNITELNQELPVTAITNKVQAFALVTEGIQSAIEGLSIKNPAAEIAEIDRQVAFLNDKNLLKKLYEQVVTFVNKQVWAAEASRKLGAFRTNGITAKQGELFTQHITALYTSTFSEECQKLNAPPIVTIAQRNAKGQTLRRLQVANNIASKILSEGEQRAITLADFLTEMQLNPKNRGIIFDDPVTSLDHQRRELIAKRLAEESVNRQVIVFTHDIALLLQLQYYAEQIEAVTVAVSSIRSHGDLIGVIHPTLPWVAQKVKDRTGYLRNEIVKLEKKEKETSEDNYISAVKTWYGLLREAWERVVEERLFKGVVERFSYSVQTSRLKKLSITDEMLKEIEKGMTESSKWVHDSAAGLNPTIPNTTKVKADLASLDEFVKNCPPS